MTLGKIQIEKYLNYLLLFLLPTQTALHFWPASSLVFGIRVDYLAPTLYLTDILFLILCVHWFFWKRKRFIFNKKTKIFFLLIVCLALVNTVFSTATTPTLYKWFRLFEMAAFYFYVSERKDVFSQAKTVSVFFYSAIFFSVIGIYHFVFGKTIGVPFNFLGERSFTFSTPGIALVKIGGRNFLRAYSTLPHPNALAAYLALTILFIGERLLKKTNVFKIAGLLIIITAYVLTFSLSSNIALLVCFVGVFVFKNKKTRKTLKYLSLVFIFISFLFLSFSKNRTFENFTFPESIAQRIQLANASGDLISGNFLLGTGLNTFIINEVKVNNIFWQTWLLQPVHNVFLLVFSEVGIFGLIFVYYIFFTSIKKTIGQKDTGLFLVLLFVLTTSLFDHYWFTLQQNLLLLAFVLAILPKERI